MMYTKLNTDTKDTHVKIADADPKRVAIVLNISISRGVSLIYLCYFLIVSKYRNNINVCAAVSGSLHCNNTQYTLFYIRTSNFRPEARLFLLSTSFEAEIPTFSS